MSWASSRRRSTDRSGAAEASNLFVGDLVGVSRQRFHELQQQPLGVRDVRFVEIALTNRRCRLAMFLALQLQEPRVSGQSVVTAIQRRDVRRDHLVLSPR